MRTGLPPRPRRAPAGGRSGRRQGDGLSFRQQREDQQPHHPRSQEELRDRQGSEDLAAGPATCISTPTTRCSMSPAGDDDVIDVYRRRETRGWSTRARPVPAPRPSRSTRSGAASTSRTRRARPFRSSISTRRSSSMTCRPAPSPKGLWSARTARPSMSPRRSAISSMSSIPTRVR